MLYDHSFCFAALELLIYIIDGLLTAYFTFVAVDSETKRPMRIPPLEPTDMVRKGPIFEAGKRRAQLRKEAP